MLEHEASVTKLGVNPSKSGPYKVWDTYKLQPCALPDPPGSNEQLCEQHQTVGIAHVDDRDLLSCADALDDHFPDRGLYGDAGKIDLKSI